MDPSKMFVRSGAAAAPLDRVAQIPEDCRVARAARVNLLLIHADEVTPAALESRVLDPEAPIATWRPGQALVLPPSDRTGTIVLHDVGALAHDDQRRLLAWLDGAAGRTQVVSTTSATLLPHVQAGRFIDRLYYRLNTVCVDLTAQAKPSFSHESNRHA